MSEKCYSFNLAIFFPARNGAVGQIKELKLKDCVAVHKLLGTVLVDQDAALSKYNQEFCCLLTYMLDGLICDVFVQDIGNKWCMCAPRMYIQVHISLSLFTYLFGIQL